MHTQVSLRIYQVEAVLPQRTVCHICSEEMYVIVQLRALTSTRSIVVIVIMGEFLSRLFEICSQNYSRRSCCLSAQEQEDLDWRIDDFEKSTKNMWFTLSVDTMK